MGDAQRTGPAASKPAEALPRPFGAYTLLRELGRGAMGIVYEALHRDLGRTVALKVLRIGFDTESGARERFRREARACAHVRHDHIVQIYEAGEIDGQPFYAMELLPGETLAARVAAGTAPSPRELLDGLAGVAGALHVLHGAGIVHRDVKPSNILIRPDGRMVLADFGLAHSVAAATLTRTGDLLGTPLYMSPEQMLGAKGEVDARTDVYGLGATLYEALTGRPVFKTDSVPALAAMILTQRPEPPRRVAPGVPPDCERIALKALEKRKEDRYQTAAEMRDAMLAFAEGRPVIGGPVSRPLRMARFAMRHWIPVAVAVVATALGALWWTHRPGDLSIESLPGGAEALVDGWSGGITPTSLSLSTGAHEVTLRRSLFLDNVQKVMVQSGSNRVVFTLWPKDPRDPEALRLLGDAVGVKFSPRDLPQGQREPPEGDPVEIWIPRGDVRVDDLTTMAMDIDAERVRSSGTLEFRKGAQILWTGPFDPHRTPFGMEIPPAVRAGIHVDDTVTWGWWPEAAAPVTASFRVVGSETASDLGRIADRLGGLPGHVAQHVRAQFFLDRRLYTAAFLEAQAILNADASDVRALAVVRDALAGVGLEESRKSDKVRNEIRSAPVAERDRVFRATAGGAPPGK